MAISTEKRKQFINKVGEYAHKEMLQSGVLASLTIAQAVLESNYGTSSLAVKGNALFGIKADKNWTGKVFSKDTKECYDGLNMVTITDTFRAYDNWKESIKDHSKFLRKDRYKNVLGETDYKKACNEVYKAGYATDPMYPEKLIKIIKQYSLTRFDTVKEVKNKKYYRIQIGAYKELSTARKIEKEEAKNGYTTLVKNIDGLYKVFLCKYLKRTNAETQCKKLKKRYKGCFVIFI